VICLPKQSIRPFFEGIVTVMFFTRTGGRGVHQSHVLRLGKKERRGEEAQKHRTYIGAKCNIVEC
jgi:hypothetical protein